MQSRAKLSSFQEKKIRLKQVRKFLISKFTLAMDPGEGSDEQLQRNSNVINRG